MSTIDFYFDFLSPYAYFGSTQIEALASKHGRRVDWKPILIGVTIVQIMGLKPLMETPLKSDYIRHDKNRLAQLFDVPCNGHSLKDVRSVNALRAFLWLKQQDPAKAVEFARRIFHLFWVEGVDITAAGISADVAAELGYSAHAALEAVASDEVKDSLKNQVNAAVQLGVFGTPFFIADGEPFWGVDRLWMLEHWLTHRQWGPRLAASGSTEPPA